MDFWRVFALACIVFCRGGPSEAGNRVLFVDATAKGLGDGTTWADAIPNLRDAILLAESGDQMWVAGGVHRAGTNRADSFILKEGVEILGGFAGNEDPASFHPSNRDFLLNETVLEGDVGAPGPADNVFHVATAMNVSRAAVLDGFTIANGNANGLTLMQQDVGGGLFIVNASPTIRRCLIRDNRAGSRGGAVHIAGGSPLFGHCQVVGNQTTVTQAANNLGGAVYFSGTAAVSAAPIFVNCLLTGNRAGVGNGGTGGAMYGGSYATATLINCTILHNRADTLTGGIHASVTIANCIVHANQDRNGFEPTAQLRGAITASHSLVQGGWPGDGNLNADPLFRNALGGDGLAGTLDDDARLDAGSPCIDAGDNFAWPAEGGSTDLDGAVRFMNDPSAADTGTPPGAALIDLGAYENQSPCLSSSECDDGVFCNGEEYCANGFCRPGAPPDCADSIDCTTDRCAEVDRTCVHEVSDTLCDNSSYCDGVERCEASLGCLPGAAPDCDDDIDCTFDACDEVADQCGHVADHAACDDGEFCNGDEVCDFVVGCVEATAQPCDDAVDCTVDTCDEGGRACGHEPNHAACDDGIYCNGVEQCATAGCSSGVPPCGADSTCDENADRCIAAPVLCLSQSECDDGNPCTDDRCVQGSCEFDWNELVCVDGNACTEDDRCENGVCLGKFIAGCGSAPPDPGPGGTSPPPVTPVTSPDKEEPGINDAGPDEESDPADASPDDSIAPPVPPAGSPVIPCPSGEPCNPTQSDDSDGDGVLDSVDQCPGTPPDEITDESGCEATEPEPGRGTWVIEDSRRCGACGAMGAMGSIGVVMMICVPGTVLVLGRPRGRKFAR